MSEQHPPEQHPSESGDGFHVEVSDVSTPISVGDHLPRESTRMDAPTSPFASRLTRRGRLLRTGGIAGAILLALILVLNGSSATRNGAIRLLADFYPTPTATLIPGSNAYFLLPNPPGTTILLDGKPLSRLPFPGDPQPLLLSRGAHSLTWKNAFFPFHPASCRLTVPRARRDTCTLIQPYQVPLPDGSAPLPAPIVAERLTLAALPAPQAAALTTAVQTALADMTTSATVAPGDHYLQGNSGAVATATQPFTAFYQVRQITTDLADSCFLTVPVFTCPYLGQDCNMLCTLPNPSAPGTGAHPEWIIGTPVQVIWSYIATDGTLIQSNVQPSEYGAETALLGVTWDGTTWRAQSLLGYHAAVPASDDLVCDDAWQAFFGSPVNYFFYPDASNSITFQCASGAQVSDGSVIRLANNGRAPVPIIPGNSPALFLERYGVLLAASDAAHQLWPDLPQADAAERQAAQQLAAALE
jgi:hypothetical protein